ncbi:MAG: 1-deoxy-D-xylulose-5-phosphate reductoisomerase, partial [Ktedonobacteraceae bacterium]|nr:1-deoxy-D-xylulose-5-phosphate reductoisomerase [Ktedonobacteraceae bacterium]
DFPGIARLIEEVLERHQSIEQPDVTMILEACAWARKAAREISKKRV